MIFNDIKTNSNNVIYHRDVALINAVIHHYQNKKEDLLFTENFNN